MENSGESKGHDVLVEVKGPGVWVYGGVRCAGGGVFSSKVFASPSTTDLSLVPRTHEKKTGPLMCREAETGRHLGDWLASRSSLVREFWVSERHCVKRVS